VIDGGTIHLFLPHLWNRAVYMHLEEKDLAKLPTVRKLAKRLVK
jgi:hypothetical protein